MVIVLVQVAAGCPNAGSGSCHGWSPPVIWGSETRCGEWQRGDKVECSTGFYMQQSPSLSVLFEFVRCLCHKDHFL